MTSPFNIRGILAQLGVDPNNFRWESLAACVGLDPESFFDDYEGNRANQVDQICLGCPSVKECFFNGQENTLTGVWGGFYLDQGQISPKKNKHKSKDLIKSLSELIYE